jgi:fibro-slime domain-containing protein
LDTHPDFEDEPPGVDLGIVEARLGADGKPVYARESGRTLTTTGKANFDQWFRDVPGVNQSTAITIPLTPSTLTEGVFAYHNGDFFPIDGQLLGNQGRARNFHFTLELHTEFRYVGGERFQFSGDDDMWVFVNGSLAIDLGGLHQELSQTVRLDEHAAEWNIQPGNVYDLDLFFAERHTIDSNFHIETTIAEFANCE